MMSKYDWKYEFKLWAWGGCTVGYDSKLREPCKTGLVMQSDPIRKLILEHPDLPVVFMENGNTGDYSLMFCTKAHAEIGEILDCWKDINPDIKYVVYTDRDDFRETINEHIYGLTGCDDRGEEWYESEIKRIEELYDPYWRKCIIITVGNKKEQESVDEREKSVDEREKSVDESNMRKNAEWSAEGD